MDVLLAIVSIAVGLAVGGHLLYGITQYKLVIDSFGMIGSAPIADIFMSFVSAFGGSVFYGGFLGGIAGLAVFLRIEKNLNKKDFFDLYALGIPLFHTFGRIGCFLGGCCYGVESSFGFIVEKNDYSPGLAGVRRFPLQLLEALLNLILFFVLWAVYRHYNSRTAQTMQPSDTSQDAPVMQTSDAMHTSDTSQDAPASKAAAESCQTSDIPQSGQNKMTGRFLFLYMLIYPVYRFILEFFRGDEIRGFWFGLSTSQWISIFLFAAGIIGMIVTGVRRRKL